MPPKINLQKSLNFNDQNFQSPISQKYRHIKGSDGVILVEDHDPSNYMNSKNLTPSSNNITPSPIFQKNRFGNKENYGAFESKSMFQDSLNQQSHLLLRDKKNSNPIYQSSVVSQSNFGGKSCTSQTYTAAAKSIIRKDPTYEFFTMMLLAHKMKN